MGFICCTVKSRGGVPNETNGWYDIIPHFSSVFLAEATVSAIRIATLSHPYEDCKLSHFDEDKSVT